MTETVGATKPPGLVDSYRGMGRFLVLWAGQMFSLVGNSMTRFAFIFYVFHTTGSAANVTLVALFSFLPKMLASPTAGYLVDRLNDKVALLITDLGTGLVILVPGFLYFSGGLQLWQLYIASAVAGAIEAFQYPAFSAALTTLVSKPQLAKANSLLSAARSGADLAGPVCAGMLLSLGSLGLVFVVDAITSFIAVITVVLIPIATRASVGEPRIRFWEKQLTGLRWIWAHPPLRFLALMFFVVNLAGAFGQVIMQPMVLARSGGSSATLSVVLACVGAGGIIGGFAVSAWGGPTHKVRGLLLGLLAVSVLGQIGLGLSGNIVGWCITGFLNSACVIVINTCNQVVWQVNVPTELLGKVFGGFVFLAQLSVPIAIALAGPLADHIFEPWARSASADRLGWSALVGSGPGAGMATMLVIAGTLGTLCGVLGLMSRSLRQLGVSTQAALAESDKQ
ncbi:MFS transporter [Amycolatopsis sulphurea]|uniref:MFS transporter n=1 Tax=Amycolatopsis sulphurea TaxID=76022 RepID=A0A2A9G2A8_9PSEU|nr:MFS transporter [Amycolatopsis sulphurea]PFG57041.1 MFS transporter [Amycolatopsis sulphurea]